MRLRLALKAALSHTDKIMVSANAKGARGENLAKAELIKQTGLPFERTPSSGALGIKGLKGDLFLPSQKNLWTIEVKNYESDGFGSQAVLGKGDFLRWWSQAVEASKFNGNKPMVIYKWNRSTLYCAIPADVVTGVTNRIVLNDVIAIYALSALNLRQLFEVT